VKAVGRAVAHKSWCCRCFGTGFWRRFVQLQSLERLWIRWMTLCKLCTFDWVEDRVVVDNPVGDREEVDIGRS
jgi:hypothetical protein